jgi:hypothetical protein
LPAAILFDLVGIVREDLGDRRLDRAGVAGLLEPFSSTIFAAPSPVSSMISNTCLANVPDKRAVGDQREQFGALLPG